MKSQDLLCVRTEGSAHITLGRLYTTKRESSHDHIDITDMDNLDEDGGNYSTQFFKKLSELSIDELIALAKSLVGLRIVSSWNEDYAIEGWEITNKIHKGSVLVREDVRDNGVSVYLQVESKAIPIRNLNGYRIVYPALTEKVYLNEDYTAIVSKTHVEVGCQKFPIEVVESILEASKRLSQ